MSEPPRLPDRERTRPSAMAGLFYPAEERRLARAVEGHLEGARAGADGGRPKAVIAPHAGYVYSGPIAGSAFAALSAWRRDIRRVVLVGPSHHLAFRGLALPDAGWLETPLGRLAVDIELARHALELPSVKVFAPAHAKEHSLEVELPFLQRLLPRFELLPLVVGDAGSAEVAAVVERLWGGDETLFVISSDLSHFLPYEAAREVDDRTAGEIVALDGPLGTDQACGARAINGFVASAAKRSLAAELIDLRNSGDTAGDRSRVVGYGAFAFRTEAANDNAAEAPV